MQRLLLHGGEYIKSWEEAFGFYYMGSVYKIPGRSLWLLLYGRARMKKKILLFSCSFIGLAGIAAGFYLTHQDTGASVEVTVDGAIYGTYPLDVDKEIPIQKDGKTTNLLVIKDGKADVTEADCPDKLCVHQKAISKTNETIVCLPNKVVVQVIGTGESELDSIAR